MPRRLKNKEILERMERSERWIMDMISGVDFLGINTNQVAEERWSSFSKGELSSKETSNTFCRCPLCRNNSKVLECNIDMEECAFFYNTDSLFSLYCNKSHRFCRECIEKIKK